MDKKLKNKYFEIFDTSISKNIDKVNGYENLFSDQSLPSFFYGDIENRDKKVVFIDFAPTLQRSLWTKEKVVLSENYSELSDKEKKKNFENEYYDFHRNFFCSFSAEEIEKQKDKKGDLSEFKERFSPFYEFSKILLRLKKVYTKKEFNDSITDYDQFFQKNEGYKLLDKHLDGIYLFPFPVNEENKKKFFDLENEKVLTKMLLQHWQNVKQLLVSLNVDFLFFNGEIFLNLLQILKEHEEIIMQAEFPLLPLIDEEIRFYEFSLGEHQAFLISHPLEQLLPDNFTKIKIPEAIKFSM